MYKVYLPAQEQALFEDPAFLPSVINITQVTDFPNFKYAAHKHEDKCEIVYLARGSCRYIIDNKEYLARQGDAVIFNRGIVHSEESVPEDPPEIFICALRDVKLKGRALNIITPANYSPLIHMGSQAETLLACNRSILQSCIHVTRHSSLRCQSAACLMLTIIDDAISTSSAMERPPAVRPLVQEIIQFIDYNYTEQISLESLSKQFFASADYISSIVKKEIGVSPIHYLIVRRIGEAQKLLLVSNKSISTIASMVGYTNINHFSNAFKKKTGISPAQFRLRYNIMSLPAEAE